MITVCILLKRTCVQWDIKNENLFLLKSEKTDGDNDCHEREHILHMDVDQKPVCSKPTQQETFLDHRIKDDGTEKVTEKSSYWEDM